MKHICVFASSSEKLNGAYYETAEALGKALGEAGIGVVFGGGRIGLMGALARGAFAAGGGLTGVLPERLNLPGIAFPHCTKVIVTPTMHERKQTMEALAEAFIALPGGFGTLEELLEVLTLKQLGYHGKPILVLNQMGFFDPLLEQFELMFATGFANVAYRELYSVVNTPQEAVAAALCYEAPALPDKLAEVGVNAV